MSIFAVAVAVSLGQITGFTNGFEDTPAVQVTTNPLRWPGDLSFMGQGQTGPLFHAGRNESITGQSGFGGAIVENTLTPPASLFVAPRSGLRAFYALPGQSIFRNSPGGPVSVGVTNSASVWNVEGDPLQQLVMWVYLPGNSPTRRFASRIFSDFVPTSRMWWQDSARTVPTIPDFYREFEVPTNQWAQIDLSTPFGQIRRFQLFGLTEAGAIDTRPYAIDDIIANVPSPSAASVVIAGGILAVRRRRS